MNCTHQMTAKTKFGAWLLDKLITNKLTCRDVAKKLKTSRQSVAFHVNGRVNPSFVNVLAYCWVFDCIEDVNEVYQMVNEEV